jgi:hypothetical protein
MIKSRMIRLTGHVAQMGRRGNHLGYWWQSRRKKDNWEDLYIHGRITLILMLERWDGTV